MTNALRGSLRKPFAEQVAAFRLRLGDLRPTQSWDDLTGPEHDRAFMVAGATKADLLSDLAGAVDSAISDGTTLDQFRADFERIVAKHGWTGWTGHDTEKGRAWRTRVIYQTNIRTSYAAGRLAQLKAGGFSYWVYLHGGSLVPREHHLAWHGTPLPPDHPFWAAHYPPNGWGCSCRVRGARNRAGIRRVGGDPDKVLPANWHTLDAKTGTQVGISKGWDYAPGDTVSNTINLASEKIRLLPTMIGAELGASMDAQLQKIWPIWLAENQTALRRSGVFAGTLKPQLLKPLEAIRGPVKDPRIFVPQNLLRGAKSRRHRGAGDALTQNELLRLPVGLQSPEAVFWDVVNEAIVYALRGESGLYQVVIRPDFRFRENREHITAAMIRTAYHKDRTDLLSRVKSGQLVYLLGQLR